MASFFGRKYLRGKPGPTEKWIGWFVLALLGGIVVVFLLTGGLFQDFVNAHPTLARVRQCFGISDKPLFAADPRNLPQPAPPRPARITQLTPTSKPAATGERKAGSPKPSTSKPGIARFAEVPGGRLIAPLNVERYTDNMYEKIDGKESAFRAFNVVDLRFGQYAEPDRQQMYDVYVYDMAGPANAMGIYASERVAKAAVLAIGREAYSSGASVFFWKGQYYVNVMGPPGGSSVDLDNSKQIATAIAETIADDGLPFWAESMLPAEGRLPNSLSYQATSALGYEFINRMFFAGYNAGGKESQMFITKAVDAPAAASMFARFAESTARYDKVLSRESLDGGEIMLSESPRPGKPSRFGSAFHKGPYFGGVTQCEDHEWAMQQAKELLGKLSANDPGDPAAAVAPPVAKPPADHDDTSEAGEGGESDK